ncbi:hypothetical protein BPNPMPFG_003609 [Mesorhizobium sp. AR07]|uniref:hypothetical protein n=1 Tax=Mesorhizobium sp. AR07 TaxID=2865838 RepID=UPI00215ED561|nr:hypothetical protein [Mesorhizobium sp. AR07]UVK41986.1 hypothetical protein BPNPMPFG_003609 [Mesorhizobium sp. AR07]
MQAVPRPGPLRIASRRDTQNRYFLDEIQPQSRARLVRTVWETFPPDDVVFNNIHNTTIINNTTINNETNNQARQSNGNAPGGLTTGQKLGAAAGLGAAALAAKVALPPQLQKRAALVKQNPSGLPAKLGQGAAQGRQPGGTTPMSKTLPGGKLSTDHALPGANGKTLPLVNGKPVLNSQTLPNDKSRNLRKQGTISGNPQATGNTGAAVTTGQGAGQQNGAGNGQGKNGKFRKPPTVSGAPAGQDLNAQQKFRKNTPNALSDQDTGKPKKLTRKDLSAGQAVVVPSDQVPGNGNKKIRKLQNSGGGSAGPEINVQRKPQRQLKLQEKPNVHVFSKPQKPTFHAQPKQEFHAQPKPKIQERRLPPQPKPEFRAQPKPQIQEQRLPPPPKPQQPPGKKPSCGHPGEPACGK